MSGEKAGIAGECCVSPRKSELDEKDRQDHCRDGVPKFALSTGLAFCAAQRHRGNA